MRKIVKNKNKTKKPPKTHKPKIKPKKTKQQSMAGFESQTVFYFLRLKKKNYSHDRKQRGSSGSVLSS